MKHALLLTQIFFAAALTALVAGNHRLLDKETGELKGTLTDAATGKGLAFVAVVLYQDNIQKGGAYTDEHGYYIIRHIAAGTFEVRTSFVGYHHVIVKGVVVNERAVTELDIVLTQNQVTIQKVVITAEPNMVDPDRTQISVSKTRKEIQVISGTAAGVHATNNVVSIGGSRSEQNKYYVDGISMRGNVNLPSCAVEQQTIVTSGVPAKYGSAHDRNVGVRSGSAPGPGSMSVQDKRRKPLPAIDPVTTDEFKPVHENNFKRAFDEPLSTFSIDVDNASYAIMRRILNANQKPSPDVIRIEELVNYFQYDYAEPADEHPFSVQTESALCPWNETHHLIKVAIKGRTVRQADLPPANLVFLIDVSGSMYSADRLPLVKTSLKYLIKALRHEDYVSLVVYAGSAGLVLPPTSGADKLLINQAIDNLQAGGSTAGGAGIQLAYSVARKNFIQNGNNRVILATDGDFNVGVSSEGELERLIEKERGNGVFLTVLGYGMGNYKDAKMETLADKGNGNYFYIDSESEGNRVFTENLAGTLYTIAKDVKLQIEFNPAKVKAYRLLGYENRLLNKEDFNDDRKDAGELGAGTCVTAFYEIIPFNSEEEPLTALVDTLKYQAISQSFCHIASPEAMTVKLRYKEPADTVSKKIEVALLYESQPFDSASMDFRFAAAVVEFGLLLRNSQYRGTASYDHVITVAEATKRNDEYRNEFIQLVNKAMALQSTALKGK